MARKREATSHPARFHNGVFQLERNGIVARDISFQFCLEALFFTRLKWMPLRQCVAYIRVFMAKCDLLKKSQKDRMRHIHNGIDSDTLGT